MLEFAQEFRDEGDDRFDLLLDDTDGFFELANRFERDLDLPDDRVPMTHFEPSLGWNRDLAASCIEWAKENGENLYFMPIRLGLREYLGGLID